MKNASNSIQLIGRLGRTPELRTLPSGSIIATVSMATNDFYKDQNGKRKETMQWHRLVAWNSRAEFMGRNLKKGQEVAIVGKLVYRNYEDKNGIKRTIAEINVEDFQLLGKTKQACG